LTSPYSTLTYAVSLTRNSDKMIKSPLEIVPFDISLDGVHHGQLFDFLVRTQAEAPPE